MNENVNLVKMIKENEGFRSKPYFDTEKIGTIGYGFTYLTLEECESILNNRIESCAKELYDSFGKEDWFKKLTHNRICVLTDMCYNLGILRLNKFVRFFALVSEGNDESASKEMLNSRWAHQVGDRAIRNSKIWREG